MNSNTETLEILRTDLQKSLASSAINPNELSTFQRILLTTDGMVTEMLEAYFQDHIVVTKLAQENEQLTHMIEELGLEEGDTVMHRSILLKGEFSQRNHLYADSAIAVDRLIKPIRDGLIKSRKPIGLLILENRLETFREILVCERERAGHLAQHFDIDPEDTLLSRTYLVFAHREPIMLITEKFPETFFAD